MKNKKIFFINGKDIKQLIPNMGWCIASDKITVDGEKIHYLYREELEDGNDSGWRFFSGSETQEYADNPDNFEVYDVNTIANYDQDIIPLLNSPIGSEYERAEDKKFVKIE